MTPQLEKYIEDHISPEPELLKEIDRKTNLYHINGRMCSGHIQGRILKMLTAMAAPRKVLELGTFTGYSALCIAEALPEGGIVDTVEADDELEEELLQNFSRSPYGEKIRLHIEDALQFMKKCPDETYDMIVIDADKRQYPAYFMASLRLLKPGGYILADNTLWDGHVADDKGASSQTKGIIEFNNLVKDTPGVETAILPFRDGLSIIRKKPEE